MTIGWRKPAVATAQGGVLGVEYLKVGANATAAKMLPGIVVIRDTIDYAVKEGSATNPIGVLGYEETPAEFRPATRETAYAVGDTVAVHVGVHRHRCLLTTSQTIVKGQPLTVTTDGYLTAATVGTHDVFADAAESVTTTTAAAYIWVTTRK